MRRFASHSASPCKRDALPTELIAPTTELRGFTPFLRRVKRHENGTERKLTAGFGLSSPEIVPNWISRLGKLSFLGWLAYEAWGLLWAGPILLAMFVAGDAWMKAWIVLCCAAGLAVPAMVWTSFNARRGERP